MPLQRVMEETTSSEFAEWMVFLGKEAEDEQTATTKQDYYLAQIAKEVFCSNLTKAAAKKVKIPDFILPFKKVEASEPKWKANKAKWMAAFGTKVIKKRKRK